MVVRLTGEICETSPIIDVIDEMRNWIECDW